MSHSTGNTIYGENGSSYRVAGEIGRGGEGSVWSLDNDHSLVAKFYHNGLTENATAKLSAMCRLRTDQLTTIAAWPITLLKHSRNGRPVGVLMRRISGFQSVHQLYGMKSRLKLFPEAQFPFLLHTAINTARAFATVHNSGQVIGDVNHSNLLISQNATVALIDCDSFQITEGGKQYVCPVGVPEFTPPELQGGSFSTQPRTSQHDAFGLSVLVFYLLFLGRHPFMGMYDRVNDELLSLDQAIGRYAFPYGYDASSPEVKLPSFVPRLSDFPPPIGSLFKQAFTRESIQRGRPSASAWVDALSLFSRNLHQCRGNPNHHYFNGLKDCPWCRMEGVLGTPIFGISVAIRVSGQGFNLLAVWSEIELVKAAPDLIAVPDVAEMERLCTPDTALPGLSRSRRKFRLIALAVAILPAIVAFVTLTPFVAIGVIVASLFASKKLWAKGNAFVSQFYEAQKSAVERYRSVEASLQESSNVPKEFSDERKKLEHAKAEYQGLEPEKAKRLAQLQGGREKKQLQRFLEQFRLEDETISGIGPKFKALLRLWNIEDAWDIDHAVISGIKGFGPVKVSTLVAWRQSKERMFRFDPGQPVDPRDINALEQEFTQKRQSLQNILRSGPEALRQRTGVWQARRRQIAGHMHQISRELAQASVNRDALKGL
jgi:DNA-binding helix-hairpin-helix protein with protein kinase domain